MLNEAAAAAAAMRSGLRTSRKVVATTYPLRPSFCKSETHTLRQRGIVPPQLGTESVMITLENWRQRMEEDMRLRDLRPRTVDGYLLAVRLFLDRTGKEPETIVEEDIRAYVLHLRDERHQAPSSINIATCALRFFCNFTLQRDYEIFQLLRVNRPRSLPVVLSQKEVRALLGVVRHPVRRMILTTIYALGLRISEGLRLEIKDIDSGRQMVWVRDGKGVDAHAV